MAFEFSSLACFVAAVRFFRRSRSQKEKKTTTVCRTTETITIMILEPVFCFFRPQATKSRRVTALSHDDERASTSGSWFTGSGRGVERL
jgi:hypothetical protein